MKDYIALLFGSGGPGCDYTIGCAQTIITIEADSDDEARKNLADKIIENYTGEFELSKALLFRQPIGNFNLSQDYGAHKIKKEEEKRSMQHLKDNEEFERLRKKLNK